MQRVALHDVGADEDDAPRRDVELRQLVSAQGAAAEPGYRRIEPQCFLNDHAGEFHPLKILRNRYAAHGQYRRFGMDAIRRGWILGQQVPDP
jgi:hypothetical protein